MVENGVRYYLPTLVPTPRKNRGNCRATIRDNPSRQTPRGRRRAHALLVDFLVKTAPWYAWLLPVGLLTALWALGWWGMKHGPSALPPAPQPPTPAVAQTPASGLVSPAGRLHVGTSLYLKGDYVATVTRLTGANPETGASERIVWFDTGRGEEYRPEWAINANYQVMAEEKPEPGVSAAQWRTLADEAQGACEQWRGRTEQLRAQITEQRSRLEARPNDRLRIAAIPAVAVIQYRSPSAIHSDRERFEHNDAQGRAWRHQAMALEKYLADP